MSNDLGTLLSSVYSGRSVEELQSDRFTLGVGKFSAVQSQRKDPGNLVDETNA